MMQSRLVHPLVRKLRRRLAALVIVAVLASAFLEARTEFAQGAPPRPDPAAVAHSLWFREITCGRPVSPTGQALRVRISPARVQADACFHAPASAPVFIALTSAGSVNQLAPEFVQRQQPDARTWLVTVHADSMTDGTLFTLPRVVHVYSLSIDARTGRQMTYCAGCALLG